MAAPTSRRLAATLVSILAVTGLDGCLGVDVGSTFDRRVDFQTYRRIAWRGSNRAKTDASIEGEVREAVEHELQGRGFEIVPDEVGADLVASYDTTAQVRTKAEAVPTYGTFRTRIGGYGQDTYLRTTLVIDLIDTRSRELVWRGWAAGFAIDENEKRERATIHEVVHQILEEYPPGPRTWSEDDREPGS